MKKEDTIILRHELLNLLNKIKSDKGDLSEDYKTIKKAVLVIDSYIEDNLE